jgi:STAS domain-containing protein
MELDLTGLTFIDAAGLRLLIRARAHALATGSRLEIELGDGCARRLAELTETVEHLQGRLARDLAMPAASSLQTANLFVDWSRDAPFRVIRGAAGCALQRNQG